MMILTEAVHFTPEAAIPMKSFSEPLFVKHLLGGLKSAIGNNVVLDFIPNPMR